RPRSYATVFFRVLVASADALRVELWDRGEFHGARSVTGEGSRQVRARRLALGAAELVRRLRQKRLAEARQLAEDKAKRAREEAQQRDWAHRPTLALGAAGTFALVGPGDLWLAGPELAGQLRPGHAARVDLAVRWMWGRASDVDDSTASWLELAIVPSHLFRF